MKITRLRVLLLLLGIALGGWLCLVWLDRSYQEPPNYSRIEPGVFLGGFIDKPPPGIDAVLNLCEFEDSFAALKMRWRPIRDAGPAPDLKWLQEQVDFLAEQRSAGRSIYVHCYAGVSRSATVLAAYYMQQKDLTRDQALEFLKTKRPQIRPNPAFMEMLLDWQHELRGEVVPQKEKTAEPKFDVS